MLPVAYVGLWSTSGPWVHDGQRDRRAAAGPMEAGSAFVATSNVTIAARS